MTNRNQIVMNNGYFDTSEGVHQYAVVSSTSDGLRRQTNEFYDEIYRNGGRILNEKRSKTRNGCTCVVFTYRI